LLTYPGIYNDDKTPTCIIVLQTQYLRRVQNTKTSGSVTENPETVMADPTPNPEVEAEVAQPPQPNAPTPASPPTWATDILRALPILPHQGLACVFL